MAIKKIITVPNPILRKKSKPVKKVDKKIKQLANDLIETAKAAREPKSVGLSAVQVGKLVRMLVIKNGSQFEVFINPQITWQSKKRLGDVFQEKQLFLEGCLSLPGYFAFVDRPYGVKVKWQDLDGQAFEKKFEDREASYIQHEIDHLDGILFPDRAIKQKSKIFQIEKDKGGEEVFKEVDF